MKRLFPVLILILIFFSSFVFAETNSSADEPKINWIVGPSVGNLGTLAEVKIPEGYLFADKKDTLRLMEKMQNPTSGEELGIIFQQKNNWYCLFEFDEVGYVKDDEKDSLDDEAMLKSIKEGTEESNKERKRRGWAELHITGWEKKPEYNPTTHNLEWAIRGESEGQPVINFNTRLLGRSGVMKVTLVTDPGDLEVVLPRFQNLLSGFTFKEGQQYAQYKAGDKVAEYGLTALVVGGAAAVAAKSGLLKGLWKIIIIVFAAIAGFFKKIFGRKSAPTNSSTINQTDSSSHE